MQAEYKHEDVHHEAITRLERLADELAGRGCMALVENEDAPVPRLWVHAARLDERVYAAPTDGGWWFWRARGERIVPCHAVREAADQLCRTVRAEA